jgi:hypothetical protein
VVSNFNSNTNSYAITRLDGITGQPYPSYDLGPYHDLLWSLVHPDGTVFVVENDSGGATSVIGIDPTTGTQKFSLPVLDANSAPISISGPSGIEFIPPIIAGDGYAYLAYVYRNNPCDGIQNLALLRIDTTGGYTNIPVLSRQTHDECEWEGVDADIITNADTGVLVSWTATDFLQSGPYATTFGTAIVTGTSVSMVNGPLLPSQSPVTPALQSQDGSYIGTAEVSLSPTTSQGTMVAFDQTGNIRWSVPGNWQPQIATADGGVIATQLDTNSNPIATVTFDQNGNATGQVSSQQIYSWKGVYQNGSVDAVDDQGPNVGQSYGSVRKGNLTANQAYTRVTRFGLAWCGTSAPGGLASCNDAQIPAQDMKFLYHNVCNSSIPDVDFTSTHPEWVKLIEDQALSTLKAAFNRHSIMVQAASKDEKSTWADCQSDPKCLNTNVADQGHLVRVGGDINAPGYGKTAGNQITPMAGFTVTLSNVYYYPIMTSAITGLWNKASPTNSAAWCPAYPPRPGTDDAQKFWSIMTTIGTAIGNAAAHELGHQLSKFPYMDCGPANLVATTGGMAPPYLTCQNSDNFVYNFWTEAPTPSDPNNPADAANGGLFFYGLDVRSIQWEQQNRCYLGYFGSHEWKDDDSPWGKIWKGVVGAISSNPCNQ